MSSDPASNFVSNAGDEGFEPLDPSQAYAAIAAADARLEQLRAEPEKIRLWREEHTKYLNEKGIDCLKNETHTLPRFLDQKAHLKYLIFAKNQTCALYMNQLVFSFSS